jgi:hypothetical protein
LPKMFVHLNDSSENGFSVFAFHEKTNWASPRKSRVRNRHLLPRRLVLKSPHFVVIAKVIKNSVQ